MIYTTLNKIRAHHPCKDGWRKLLAHLGKTAADDEPIGLDVILESNGLDDALWCLRSVPEESRRWRHLAVRFARTVEHLMTDDRSRNALVVAERHADGLASDGDLAAAWDAAEAATRAAARAAARDAAEAATRAAARAAAWDAAEDAARAAARAAARDAAEDAARAAARAAARDAAEAAARAAARAAAWGAAEAATRAAARAAARDAAEDAARAAARAAARDAAEAATRAAARDAAEVAQREIFLSALDDETLAPLVREAA